MGVVSMLESGPLVEPQGAQAAQGEWEVISPGDDDLADAETRLLTKWVAAMEARGVTCPSEPFNVSDWMAGDPPPDPVLQFPRPKFIIYPNTRAVALAMCDRMLDFADRLTGEQWATLAFLIQYGGRTPL